MQLKSITAIIVLLLVVVSLLVAGCTTTTTNSGNANTTQTLGGMEVHAQNATAPRVDSATPTLSAGHVYVTFNCTVKNINAPSGDAGDITPFYWHLRDNAGNVYDVTANIYKTTPTVKIFTDLPRSQNGDVMSGYVFFEVPSNHGAWKSLTYDHAGYTEVTFNL